MQRVSVVGNSGSGKTTLARALAARLGAPFVELDAINHQPGWVPLEPPVFREKVAEVAAGERWVVDGNYSVVRDLIWERADTVVWLDLPRVVITTQILWRSVTRSARHEELWNGNREEWSNLLSLDPQKSVVMWSITRHGTYRRRYLAAMEDPRWSHLRFIRVRSRPQARRMVEEAPVSPA